MFHFLLSKRILQALVLTLCEEDEAVYSHVNLERVVENVKKMVLSLPLFYRVAFCSSLFFFEYATVPFVPKILPFSWMRLSQRIDYLKRWKESLFFWRRLIYKLLSSPCLMHLFAEEKLLHQIGFSASFEHRLQRPKATPSNLRISALEGFRFDSDQKEICDVVIVGSGAGGAVLAKELAEGGMKVLLLEEGGLQSTLTHTDLPTSAIRRLYRDLGFTSTFGQPFIPIPMGKVLGGTTVINSGTCFRTPGSVFKHWNENLGLNEICEEEFQSYFERIEREIHVTESDFRVMGRSNQLFHEFLKKEGIHGRPLLRNIRDCEGCGFCCYGCPSGAKQSMDVSYLPKASAAGAKMVTNCRVDRIKLHAGRVVGLVANFFDSSGDPTGKKLEVSAEKVVIAAGSIHTPYLLKKNGIASQNPHLGLNLTIHPATKIFAEFDSPVMGWEGTPQAYYLDLFKDFGIAFEGIFMPPDVAAMAVPFVGKKLSQFMLSYRYMATFGFLISDSSSGRVQSVPFLGPSVFYSLTQEDVERIRKGVLFLTRIFFGGGAKRVMTLLRGYSEFLSIDDLKRLESGSLSPKDVECMAFHPLGSCKMGKTKGFGVVGQDHQVFDCEGIYVCDGSVIPSSLGVNPQVTIMAFATRLAAKWLNKKLG